MPVQVKFFLSTWISLFLFPICCFTCICLHEAPASLLLELFLFHLVAVIMYAKFIIHVIVVGSDVTLLLMTLISH